MSDSIDKAAMIDEFGDWWKVQGQTIGRAMARQAWQHQQALLDEKDAFIRGQSERIEWEVACNDKAAKIIAAKDKGIDNLASESLCFRDANTKLEQTIANLEAEVARLRAENELAIILLDAANCPECGDKSGAYYSNDGDVCQCQWCDEVFNLKPITPPKGAKP